MEDVSGRMERKEKVILKTCLQESIHGGHQNVQDSFGFFLLLNADKRFKLWPSVEMKQRQHGRGDCCWRLREKQHSYVERSLREGKTGWDS